MRGESISPSRRTANGCSESGTGVKKSGTARCAHTAARALPARMIPTEIIPIEPMPAARSGRAIWACAAEEAMDCVGTMVANGAEISLFIDFLFCDFLFWSAIRPAFRGCGLPSLPAPAQDSRSRLSIQVGLMGGIEGRVAGVEPGAMDPDVARHACGCQQQSSQ